jgi:hypothetical protein
MQLSANLPSGTNAVQNYTVSRAETGLLNNVRAEADAAYISEKGLRSGNERTVKLNGDLPAVISLAVSIRVELSGPSAKGSRLDFRAAFL